MADDADAQAIANARTRSRKKRLQRTNREVLINQYECVDPVHPSHIPTDKKKFQKFFLEIKGARG